MDEKVREIEKNYKAFCDSEFTQDSVDWLTIRSWYVAHVGHLLSLLEEKEKYAARLLDEGIDFYTQKCKAEARIKELGIEFDGLHQIIEELIEERDGYKEALNVRKKAIDQATSGIGKLNERIKDLEEGIENLPGNRCEHIQAIMKKHDFVIDNLDDRWQKFAFTLYSEIVEMQSKIEDLYNLLKERG